MLKENPAISREEILRYLHSADREEIGGLFKRARKIREEVQGNKIFTYGFVYFTTYCRNHCNFCYYRAENQVPRYRKSMDEIVETAGSLVKSGVNLIDLTMGEDPLCHQDQFEEVSMTIREIKKRYQIPVMISPGVVSGSIVDKLRDSGADFFAVYQETHNRELFAKLRVGQDYDRRMNCKLYAKKTGMFIEEGLLTGVGEDEEDIADSLLQMLKIQARQCRVMSFVPQKGSPMEDHESPSRIMELKIIALMRILYPKALIPASLDVDGIGGLKERILAGANLITSIIPPKSGFRGVAHATMDVDEGGRTVEEVSLILGDMGMRTATTREYLDFL